MTAGSWNFFEIKSCDEFISHISMRRNGHRVIPLRHLPGKPQSVEALLVGVNGELWVTVRADVEVELEVIIVGRVILPLKW